MNKLKSLLITTIAATALPLSAANYVFVAESDTLETRLCIAAAENNLKKYKNTAKLLSRSSIIHKTLAQDLTCNDQGVANFAYQYDANKTLKFIDRFAEHDIEIRREISQLKEANKESENGEQIVYVKVK